MRGGKIVVAILVFVDDFLLAGSMKACRQTLSKIKGEFKVKTVERLTEVAQKFFHAQLIGLKLPECLLELGENLGVVVRLCRLYQVPNFFELLGL